jgi:hypothetical protein
VERPQWKRTLTCGPGPRIVLGRGLLTVKLKQFFSAHTQIKLFFIYIYIIYGLIFFFKLFLTREWTPHILRFDFVYTVIIPAAPQETMEEAGIEPGTAALQSGSLSRALAN